MYKSILSLLCAVLFLASCNSKSNVETITVASDYGDCVGLVPQKCLLIKFEGKSDWEFWYSGIDEFNYEPGYEYVLEVKKETLPDPVPADRSSIKYVFVKEVSKTQKKSENLPG